MHRVKLLLLAAVLLSFTACAGEISSESTTAYSGDNDARIRQMIDSITLDGKSVKLPFSENDLPSGFSLREGVYDYGEYHYCILMHECKDLFPVYLQTYDTPENKEGYVVFSLANSTSTGEDNRGILQIDGVGLDSTTEDITQKFGEPTNISFGSDGLEVLSYESDESRIVFYGKPEEKITKILAVNGRFSGR